MIYVGVIILMSRDSIGLCWYMFSIVDGVCTVRLGFRDEPAAPVMYSLILLLHSVAPVVVMSVANIGIFYQLKARSARKQGEHKNTKVSRQSHSVTPLLMGTSLFAIVLHLYLLINVIFTIYYASHDNNPAWTPMLPPSRDLSTILNNSANFVLYILTAKFFRDAFLKLMRTKFSRQWRRRSNDRDTTKKYLTVDVNINNILSRMFPMLLPIILQICACFIQTL